jgi:hypothetical protein
MHLTGDQWGVINETGSYPGQPWLWLYQLRYHVAPFSNSPSVDVWAVYLTGIATLLLLAIGSAGFTSIAALSPEAATQ